MTETFTTREAARRCGVNFRTVIRWAERGELQAYRLPGRGDYRVPVEELRRFMREHGIPEPDEMPGSPKRVLVVDDEPAVARTIKRVLARAGFETAIAGDGLLAGSLLHTFKPHLMTLDLRMPGIDGLGVLRFLRETPLPTPLKVLVVSGDSEEHVKQALALGAHGALCKPFDNEELLAAARELLGEAKAPTGATRPRASSG
ncbi:response regulator [Rhizobacter sp. Root1221]|uniref:response regulator n=1 Tax=Rhizobacter sp. Root1221 TaxID=1736433 RepID=UPI0006F86142|nr:response regulator [Rhizobacter sp. Root1221]KQW02885.1 response regulator [Rhizobacter sp. Root1221]